MSGFTEWNKNWCYRFLQKHPIDKKNVNTVYEETVSKCLRPGIIVYDAGGGNHCRYIKHIDRDNMYVFALDLSEEELSINYGTDGGFVTDISKDIPIPYGQVDMITSSMVCEYLENPIKYYKNAYKALKPYGLFINLFTCRYSNFATMNRLLPKEFVNKFVEHFLPSQDIDSETTTYYEGLWYSKVKSDYKKAGFRIEKIYLNYSQCNYYNFFIPLFLINYIWDWLMKKFKMKNMCSHMLIMARKMA